MTLAPIPADPEPTEAELATFLGRDSHAAATMFQETAMDAWRIERQRVDPNAFLVCCFTGHREYAAYRRLRFWKAIELRVLEAAGRTCAACSRTATKVHHRDYRPRVLAGLDDTPLVPLCEACFNRVHYLGTRTSWPQQERVLAELVATTAPCPA